MTVLLSVRDVTKAFGPKPLFSQLSLDLREGEKVGLIGPNGAGKSTLLKILAGLDESDEGSRSQRRAMKLGFVAQDDRFAEGLTVRDVVLAALNGEPIEDHEKETRANIVLDRVGFLDDAQPAHLLSGGWRKRLSLARELIRQPDILLLDEPTNHLDLPGIFWLEKLLRASPFGYLVATHDRAFLRAVTDDVVEINRMFPEGYFRQPGTYDQFIERREEFLEAQERREETVANQVRRETDWLGRKAAARTRKAASRIDDAYKRRDELAELKYRNASNGAANIDFVSTGRQTRKLLTATGLAKSMGPKKLFSGLDLILAPGTKLGLLGPNGSGKSVFLRTISGEHKPDEGTIVLADGLRVVMFEQGRTALDPNQTLRKALCPNGDIVRFGERSIHVAAWARQFLFKAEQLDVMVGSLSGGEQARVRMAQMMLQPADLLLLDEPTNDLDIPALEVLEESLEEFPGALVIVSHDRELLDRVCTEVIGLDGQGGSARYASVTQWLNAMEALAAQAESAKPKAAKPSAPKSAPPPPKPKKLSYKEQQEFEKMEETVLAAEARVVTCQTEVDGCAPTDHVSLTNACSALEAAQQEVDRLYARWQELEEKSKASKV